MKNGMIECSVCHSKLVSPTTRGVSRAYDRHKSRVSSKQQALNVLLVVGDCVLVGFQVIHHQFFFFYIIIPISLFPIPFPSLLQSLFLHVWYCLFSASPFWFICPRWMGASCLARLVLTFWQRSQRFYLQLLCLFYRYMQSICSLLILFYSTSDCIYRDWTLWAKIRHAIKNKIFTKWK